MPFCMVLESRAGDGKTIDHLPDMQQGPGRKARQSMDAPSSPGPLRRRQPLRPAGKYPRAFPRLVQRGERRAPATRGDFHRCLVRPHRRQGSGRMAGTSRLSSPASAVNFQGAVDLAGGRPFSRILQCLRLQWRNEGRPLLCCLAAKGGNLANWTMLTPGQQLLPLPSRPRPCCRLSTADCSVGPDGLGAMSPPSLWRGTSPAKA